MGGLSNCVTSTIGVKQCCPLSLTLFGIYTDEINGFIAHQGSSGVDLGGTEVNTLLYALDVVLLS